MTDNRHVSADIMAAALKASKQTVDARIDALRKRENVCWDMSEVFLHAKDAHGLHDMGVEIQGIQWALRELEGLLRK